MESFKELASSIAEWFKNRIVNPFFAAFIFSWLALNWRVVLALGSDVSFREKINYVDKLLFPKPYQAWEYCLGWPLASAISYIVVGPHLFRIIIRYYRRQQTLTRDRLKKDDQLELVSRDEADQLRQDIYIALSAKRMVERQSQDMIAEYIREIEKLRDEVESYKKLNTDLHSAVTGGQSATPVLEDGFLSLEHLLAPGMPDNLVTALRRRGISMEEVEALRVIRDLGPVTAPSQIVSGTRHKFANLPGALAMLRSFKLINDDITSLKITRAGESLLVWLDIVKS